MNYTPMKIQAKHLTDIFAEVLGLNKTLANKYVRVESQHKDRFYVTTQSGGLEIKPYSPTPVSAGRANNILFADREIVLAKYDVFDDTLNMDSLRGSRFNSDMKAGALNTRSNEFENAVLSYIAPQISVAMEKKFWSDSVTELNAATGVHKVTATALNSTTVVDVLTDVYELIPDEVIEAGNAIIYAHPSVRKMILAANRSASFRDVITVEAGKHYFNELEVVYVPTPAVSIIAGNKTDFIWATDLEADYQSLVLGEVSPTSDMLFIRGVFAQASAVLVPSQKVIFTAA